MTSQVPPGTTRTERQLARVCEESFLKLWSIPNPHRPGVVAKEICDLLLVFGDQAVVFSDKECDFPKHSETRVAWHRWERRAVAESIRQIDGAIRHIQTAPTEVFVDRKCERRLELNLGAIKRWHAVAVATGAAGMIARKTSENGSLIVVYDTKSNLQGLVDLPLVTKVDIARSVFVHVMDIASLRLVLAENDTVFDFLRYLATKEADFRANSPITLTGEEEYLAMYLTTLQDDDSPLRDITASISQHEKEEVGVTVGAGFWDAWAKSAERRDRVASLRASYGWDAILRHLIDEVMRNTVLDIGGKGFLGHEARLRGLAAAPRNLRATLVERLAELSVVRPGECASRRLVATGLDYGYLIAVVASQEGQSEADYRELRRSYLNWACIDSVLRFPKVQRFVGVAAGPAGDPHGASEDILLVDRDSITETMRKHTLKERKKQGAFRPRTKKTTKIGRNDRCPCGSGKKLKRCCEGIQRK